uniref:Uncharacterized protein n=1 Tax=Mycoplasma feriruminatoris TaxID=1179777 RepID=A0A654IJS0_9MOLU|nr:hypothetical protein MF5292_00724 [Mycoplasma feriruminatoris]VZR75690.1 hypothetical protein MF5294_00722 [Mycoplasma feriruminatoris]VZR98277.1 hypothetical protein MF5293_00719 [Mycoplasma feriruminatoris]
MRKFSKLILAILPVSSLTVFSVVSCSTNDKKPIETPKTPVNKIPDNQPKKPEDQTESDENHKTDKPGEEKQPDGEPSPGMPDDTPEHKPHNPETQPKEPKTPGNRNSSEEQPQGDETPKNKADFSDVEKLDKEINFQYFSTYNNKDAQSGWIQIKSRGPKIFKEVIFAKNKDILDKYMIELDPENIPNIIVEKGIIDNIKIKFIKDNETKIYVFSFIGFLKKQDTNREGKNKKYDYIKPKDNITEKIKGLFPSLVAYMLLYFEENNSNNKYDRQIKQDGNVINFDQLKNNNPNLFENGFVGFSVGTKELLLNYNREYEKIYNDKITEASFDDVNGTLGLKIKIENREDNNSSEATITKEFKFDGFRKVDFEEPNNNPFSVNLLQNDLKTILGEDKIKKSIKDMGLDLKSTKITEFGVQSQNHLWENEIFKYLVVDITDNKNHIYKSKQTLKIDYNSKKKHYESILGIKPNMTLYPFNTMITKESIKNILISIEGGKVTLEFELHLPVYSTGFSDLTTHLTNGKDLVLRITQSVQI